MRLGHFGVGLPRVRLARKTSLLQHLDELRPRQFLRFGRQVGHIAVQLQLVPLEHRRSRLDNREGSPAAYLDRIACAARTARCFLRWAWRRPAMRRGWSSRVGRGRRSAGPAETTRGAAAACGHRPPQRGPNASTCRDRPRWEATAVSSRPRLFSRLCRRRRSNEESENATTRTEMKKDVLMFKTLRRMIGCSAGRKDLTADEAPPTTGGAPIMQQVALRCQSPRFSFPRRLPAKNPDMTRKHRKTLPSPRRAAIMAQRATTMHRSRAAC